ncbi:MAG: YggS family pyridoxal phosphate-dependent enzyme [Planctomycetota bacterium]
MAGHIDLQRLHDNVTRLRVEIVDACARAGRRPGDVTLVAVTKYVDLPVIRGLLAAGVRDLGENRVQQLTARAQELGQTTGIWPEPGEPAGQQESSAGPRWHMIGHLQRNKVKALLPHSSIMHSVDSPRLAVEIDKVAAQLDTTVDVLIEVNIAEEQSKYGLQPGDVPALVAGLNDLRHLRLRGLMTMAPFDPDPEHARPCFARLRETLEDLQARQVVTEYCRHLSMGMSQDYAVAVEEGATLVRVGSALYEGVIK